MLGSNERIKLVSTDGKVHGSILENLDKSHLILMF